jgi:hypothetical protein
VWYSTIDRKGVHRNRIFTPKFRCLLLAGSAFFILLQAAAQTGKKNSPVAIFEDLPVDDPAANSIPGPGEDTAQKIKKNIFIIAGASKQRCYLGEPILLTHSLYTALQSTSRIMQAPSMQGFSTQLITPPNESVVRTRRNDKTFRVFILQQQVVVPLQPGKLVIGPLLAQNDISYTSANGSTKQYSGVAASAPTTIYVDTLPAVGQPPAFSGAIGRFSIQVWVDSSATGNASPTLHIDIEGRGNFNSVEMPVVDWPPGFEPLTAFVKDTLQRNVFPPAGKKSFIIPFIAAKQGVLQLPSLSFAFFDPDKSNYQIAYSKPVHAAVAVQLPTTPAVRVKQPAIERSTALWYEILALVALAAVIAAVFVVVRKNKNRDAGL